MSDSLHHNPLFNVQNFKSLTSLTESYWIIQNKMDSEEIPIIFQDLPNLYEKQDELVEYIDDYNLEDKIDFHLFNNKIDNYLKALNNINTSQHLISRSNVFFNELKKLIDILQAKDLEKTKEYIDSTTELFRGAQGIRHVDFIGYKVE